SATGPAGSCVPCGAVYFRGASALRHAKLRRPLHAKAAVNDQNDTAERALTNLRVLDLTRVLAGPWCTQNLADLGADVIKVERPASGDDTRHWGPPFLKDRNGNETGEAAYYLAANRGKRSITLDISDPDGQAIVRKLATVCDVLVENYKVGQLAKYGLDYESL